MKKASDKKAPTFSSYERKPAAFSPKESPKVVLILGEILCYIIGSYQIFFFAFLLWVRSNSIEAADGVSKRPCVYNCGTTERRVQSKMVDPSTNNVILSNPDDPNSFYPVDRLIEVADSDVVTLPFTVSEQLLNSLDSQTIATAFFQGTVIIFVGYLTRTIRLNW
jgi:hypothetical protein